MCFTPDLPNPNQVGGDYSRLLSQFAGGVPGQLGAEDAYKPGFVRSGLADTSQAAFGVNGQPGLLGDYSSAIYPVAGAENAANNVARTGNVNSVNNLGASAAGAIQSIDPAQTALTTALTSTASTNLAAGTNLLPGDRNNIVNSVRGDWASRGLGDSGPAQLDEALQLYGGGQNALAQREQMANQAITTNQNNITLPALGLTTTQSSAPGQTQNLLSGAASLGTNAGASLVPTSELSDVLSTVYNATSASNIAGSNNRAAIAGGALSY